MESPPDASEEDVASAPPESDEHVIGTAEDDDQMSAPPGGDDDVIGAED